MNETILKFGYPETLVGKLEHWCVLMRPAQATLGALVLASTEEARAFPALSREAFAELAEATARIEAALKAFRTFERINYLMLMMVDPHVHFHVLPRYGSVQTFEGLAFRDPGWPGVPDLAQAVTPEGATRQRLVAALRTAWNETEHRA